MMSFISGILLSSELLRALFREPLLEANDPLLEGPSDPLLELDERVPIDKLERKYQKCINGAA